MRRDFLIFNKLCLENCLLRPIGIWVMSNCIEYYVAKCSLPDIAITILKNYMLKII